MLKNNIAKLRKLILVMAATIFMCTCVQLVKPAEAIQINTPWGCWHKVIVIKVGGITVTIDPITETWIFPNDEKDFVEIDPNFTPYWDVPITSGTWQSAFVWQGPNSEAYPQGGVKFYTTGEGLKPGDTGNFWIGTKLGGVPDTASHWDVYNYDSSTNSYTFIEKSPCVVPEPCTLLLFGSGLVGAIGFGRKRLFKKV